MLNKECLFHTTIGKDSVFTFEAVPFNTKTNYGYHCSGYGPHPNTPYFISIDGNKYVIDNITYNVVTEELNINVEPCGNTAATEIGCLFDKEYTFSLRNLTRGGSVTVTTNCMGEFRSIDHNDFPTLKILEGDLIEFTVAPPPDGHF